MFLACSDDVATIQTGKRQKEILILHKFVASKISILVWLRKFCHAVGSLVHKKLPNATSILNKKCFNYLCWCDVSSNFCVKFLHWSVSFSMRSRCSEIMPSSSWTVDAILDWNWMLMASKATSNIFLASSWINYWRQRQARKNNFKLLLYREIIMSSNAISQ